VDLGLAGVGLLHSSEVKELLCDVAEPVDMLLNVVPLRREAARVRRTITDALELR
jgi:hypothetical protein